MTGERCNAHPTVVTFCRDDGCEIVNIALAVLEQGGEVGLKGQSKACEDITVALECAFECNLVAARFGECFLLLASLVMLFTFILPNRRKYVLRILVLSTS